LLRSLISLPKKKQYHNGSNWVRLAAGSSGNYLKTLGAGNNPGLEITIKKGKPKSDREKLLSRITLKDSNKDKNFTILPQAYTTTAETTELTPIIEHYDGIEKNTIDGILYYLSQTQDEDGSFGTYNQYEITGEIALLLARFNRTNNGQFAAMLNYLRNTEPTNNREKAIKARLMLGLGEPYQEFLDELIEQQNGDDGGFGLDEGYDPDVITTLEATWALWAADYSIGDALPKALKYVVDQIQTDGTMYFTTGSCPSYYLANKTAEYLELFKNLSVGDGENNISIQSKIDDLLNFLSNQYDEESETLLDSNDFIDQLMMLRSFQLYNTEPDKQELLHNSAQYFSPHFAASPYETIAAMKALPQADLVITNIESTGSQVNGAESSFDVTIKNNGYMRADSIHLYVFIDNFQLNDGYDLGALGLTIEPQEEVIVSIPFSGTTIKRFLGDTGIKFYIEGENESDYHNNWFAKYFNFAGAADGSPALPIYYIAYKYDLNNQPALNIRWAKRDDPNRLNYVAMYRVADTSAWSFQPISNTWNGAFFTGFTEGETYDVTAGVVHQDAQTVTFFSSEIVQIKMSSDENEYTGNVSGYVTVNNKKTEGIYTWGYGISGSTDENGTFYYENKQNGSTAAHVDVDYYEAIITKFTIPIGETTTNVRLFTRLKPDDTPPVVENVEIRFNTDFIVTNQRTVELLAWGSDNVDLKKADFYYWNPNEESWIYIGTATADNSSIMEWYIPSNLTGSDFKIKSIFWDYQGNQSEAAEWGPFEIIDGTAPTGTLEIQGLINNTWFLGEEKTISWNIVTANPLDRISSIKLYYGSDSTSLAENYDINQSSLQYTIPLRSIYETNEAFIKITACDVNDNCSTLTSDVFFIVDNTTPPNYPWGRPQLFDLTTDSYKISRSVSSMFLNDDGSIEIIYSEWNGWSHEPEGQYRRIVYRKFMGGEWQEPVILKEYWYRSGETESVSFSNISAVKAHGGDIHIAYQRDKQELDASEIYYLNIFNGVLVSDRQISNDDTYSRGARVAVNNEGRVFIAWREGYSYANSTGFSSLHYIEGNGLSSWTNIEELTDDSTSEIALTLEQDSPVISYQYRGQYTIICKNEGSWSDPIAIYRPDIPKLVLDGFTDDADKLHLIVNTDPENEALYLWLPSIRTQADLEDVLVANNFSSKNEIISAWQKNEYAYGSYDTELFSAGNNVYELLYRHGTQETNWRYSVYYLKFSIDDQTGQSTILKLKELTERMGDEDIRAYKVIRNNDGNYHLFCTKMEQYGSDDVNRVYHLFFDGNKTYFDTRVSSLVMNVGEYLIYAKEKDNIVTVYFEGYAGGESHQFYNTADFSSIITYRLDEIYPLHKATEVDGPSATLQWSYAGGSIDSFTVLFGTNPHELEESESGLTDTMLKVDELQPDTTYYWQVKGVHEADLIYSNIWHFTTRSDFSDVPISPPTGFTSTIDGGTINLQWNDNPESDLVGYKVYWDTDSGHSYANVVDVGNLTSYTITGIGSGTYYVTVTAYDSDYDPAHDDPDSIENENQTNGHESQYAAELLITIELDSDSDGLTDELENTTCTDPFDADTDNDGISDGAEDVNKNGVVDSGETDPCSVDSDGDGIQDGTELGITGSVSDPDGDGPLFGTDTNVFIADADPDTTTDPLNNDSDDDGVWDGTEDANHNGSVDAGETDPNDILSNPSTLIHLKKGFNLIAIPADVTGQPDLRDWLPAFGDSSEIKKVMAYDEANSRFVTLIPGDSSNPSFILTGGEGLIIYATGEKQVGFMSVDCSSLDLEQGFNLIGIACPTEGYRAFDLLSNLGSGNFSSIQRYSTEKGAFETAGFGPDGQLAGVDFSIVAGEGYFIYMK